MEIPVRMRQTRIRQLKSGIPDGIQMSGFDPLANPAVQFQILSTRLSVTRRHHARVFCDACRSLNGTH